MYTRENQIAHPEEKQERAEYTYKKIYTIYRNHLRTKCNLRRGNYGGK